MHVSDANDTQSLLTHLFIVIMQDSSDQDSSADIRRLYNAYNSYPGNNMISPEERMALNRLQYEMISNYVQK